MPVRKVAPNVITGKNKADESYSLGRMMSAVANQRGIDGVEAEYDQEMKHSQPWREFGGAAVPIENIFLTASQRKEIYTSIQKASGVVTPTNLSPLTGVGHHDELLTRINAAIGKELLCGKLGGRVLTGLTEKTERIPRQTAMMTAGHVAIDADLPDSGDPAFDNYDMTPKLVGSVAELRLSSFMANHSPAHEEFFAAELRRALAQEVDRACLLGNNSLHNHEPNGIVQSSQSTGQHIVHDATAQDKLILVKKALRDYLGEANPDAKWVMSADVVDGFRTIPAFATQSGARSLMAEAGIDMSTLLGLGLVQTTGLSVDSSTTPDSVTGLLLDGSTLVHALWSGVDVALNPYADSVFKKAAVLIRVMMLHDVGVIDPKRVYSFKCDLPA